MTPTLPALLLAALLAAGHAQPSPSAPSAPFATERLAIGAFSLDWPADYSATVDGDRSVLVGPGDHRALATAWTVTPPDGEAGLPAALSALAGIARGRLPGLADSYGEVVVPLREDALPDGSRLFSTATRTTNPGAVAKTGFYVQYMRVSPTAHAVLVTVEGSGDALEQHARFLGYLRDGTREASP